MDNFEYKLVSEFEGYVSSVDRTNVSEKVLVKGSKNVYIKDSGTVAVRPGLKRRGTADSTAAGVKSSFEWPTSVGATRVLRVADSKLQVESDIATSGTYVWYNLMTSLTLTRFVFDTWWNDTAKKDQLLFVKGDTNLHMWPGGIGKISSTTSNTIVLTDTVASQGFTTASGSVTVNGTTYAYTGSSASTLTGVTPDPTGEANGSVVLSALTTSATTPASSFDNDFIKVINNRLHVGSYNSRLIYISVDSDYTSFSVPGTRAPGDAELLTLDSSAKGIGVKNGEARIAAGTAEWYEVSYSPLTVGSTLTEQTVVKKKEMDNLGTAQAHEFIDTVGDDIIYLDQNNQLRLYGTFRNFTQPQFPTLSLQITQDLLNEDFTGGELNAVGEFIYITAPINGRVWLHHTRQTVNANGEIVSERMWHPPFIWNLSRIAVIDGVEYGHSNANPQIYQLWDTNQWHDDSPSEEPMPYDASMRMSYRSMGRRQGLWNFDSVYYEGYMTQGTKLYATVNQDYQGGTAMQDLIINDPEQGVSAIFFTSFVPPSLGDSSIGVNPLGDGIVDDPDEFEYMPKFRAAPSLNPQNVFEYQLIVYSQDPDSRWEILALGANVKRAEGQSPTFIKN